MDIPILASAMDGVVDVKFANEMARLGGLACLNLEEYRPGMITLMRCLKK